MILDNLQYRVFESLIDSLFSLLLGFESHYASSTSLIQWPSDVKQIVHPNILQCFTAHDIQSIFLLLLDRFVRDRVHLLVLWFRERKEAWGKSIKTTETWHCRGESITQRIHLPHIYTQDTPKQSDRQSFSRGLSFQDTQGKIDYYEAFIKWKLWVCKRKKHASVSSSVTF